MIDYFEEIKKLIAVQFEVEPEDIEEDSDLEENLGVSDLDLEDLFVKIAQMYDIPAPMDTTQFKKVSDIVTYVYENAGEIE